MSTVGEAERCLHEELKNGLREAWEMIELSRQPGIHAKTFEWARDCDQQGG
jgi:hypothetical protein